MSHSPDKIYDSISFWEIARALLFIEFILPLLVVYDMLKIARRRCNAEPE
jgi:hypothetical protein